MKTEQQNMPYSNIWFHNKWWDFYFMYSVLAIATCLPILESRYFFQGAFFSVTVWISLLLYISLHVIVSPTPNSSAWSRIPWNSLLSLLCRHLSETWHTLVWLLFCRSVAYQKTSHKQTGPWFGWYTFLYNLNGHSFIAPTTSSIKGINVAT